MVKVKTDLKKIHGSEKTQIIAEKLSDFYNHKNYYFGKDEEEYITKKFDDFS